MDEDVFGHKLKGQGGHHEIEDLDAKGRNAHDDSTQGGNQAASEYGKNIGAIQFCD